MFPRGPVRATQECVHLIVADHASVLWIPGQSLSCLHGQIGENAGRGRYVPFFDIGDGSPAIIDSIEKIDHVTANSWSNVTLQVFLRAIFRILLEFKGNIAMHSLAFAPRRKIKTIHTCF